MKTNLDAINLENDYTITVTTKVSNRPVTFFPKMVTVLLISKSKKTGSHLLVLFGYKGLVAQKQDSSKGPGTNKFSKNDNSNN